MVVGYYLEPLSSTNTVMTHILLTSCLELVPVLQVEKLDVKRDTLSLSSSHEA